jgi:hypothetical protein
LELTSDDKGLKHIQEIDEYISRGLDGEPRNELPKLLEINLTMRD